MGPLDETARLAAAMCAGEWSVSIKPPNSPPWFLKSAVPMGILCCT